MISLHDLALLCESAYKNQNLTSNWHSVERRYGDSAFYNGEIGYLGEAFINTALKEIVVIHRGTKVYTLSDKLGVNPDTGKLNAFTSYSNLVNDGLLALQFLPPESQPAINFGLSLIEQYPNYRIVQAGHSLGGFHAHIVGYICRQEVVAFDCPGCLEQLERLTNYQIKGEQLEKHYSFLAESNLINQTNTQVGNIYFRTFPNNRQNENIPKFCVINKMEATLKGHRLQTFLNVISPTAYEYYENIPSVFVDVKTYQRDTDTCAHFKNEKVVCTIV